MPRVTGRTRAVELQVMPQRQSDDNAGEVDFPREAVAFGPGDFQGEVPIRRQRISAEHQALLTDPVKSEEYLSALQEGASGKTGIVYFFKRRSKAQEMMATILEKNGLDPKLLRNSKLSFGDRCLLASLLDKGLIGAEGMGTFLADKAATPDRVVGGDEYLQRAWQTLGSEGERLLASYHPSGKRVAELLGHVRWRIQSAKMTKELEEMGSVEARAALADFGRAEGYPRLAREILGEVSGSLQGNDLVNFIGAVGGFSLALGAAPDRQRYVGSCCQLVRNLAGVEDGGYEGLKRLYALLHGRTDEQSLMLRYVVAKNLRKDDRGLVAGEGHAPEPVPGISFGQAFYLLVCAIGEWFRESRAEKIPSDVDFLTYWRTPVGAAKEDVARIRKEVEETPEAERQREIMEILAGRV